MYTLVPSRRFRKQLKKLAASGRYDIKKLTQVIEVLRLDKLLPDRHHDHQLKGRLKEFRECHISPDWLLIYKKDKNILVLELIATGSHSELFY